MEDFSGKTAFITGGAQGIGLGIAKALAARGAKLALADVDAEALALAKAELGAITDIVTLTLDVRDRDAFAQAADEVESQLGPVDILCNNAGVAGAASIADMSYELWDIVIGINLGGFINGVQTFLPRMIERGQPGHLIFTSAGAGLAAGGGHTGYMYQTSKYAGTGMAESLSKQLELAGLPIGVTILFPGPVPANTLKTAIALGSVPADAVVGETKEEQAEIDARLAAWKTLFEQGVKPEVVGEMVVEGVASSSLYVHTDRSLWDPLIYRTSELLKAMPAIPAPSTKDLPTTEGPKK